MYSAEINRKQPALLVLLIDQSFSMLEPWAGAEQSKAAALAAAVNDLLGNAVVHCSRGDGEIHEYFDIGVLGYGQTVGPVLYGTDTEHILASVEQVAENPLRVDTVTRQVSDGAGGLVPMQQKMPIWLDPAANGGTPMTAAFTAIEPVVETWCAAHQSSFPPIVINVTDGMSTDGDPRDVAHRIRQLGTDDGKALVFNLHLSGIPNQPVRFPSSTAGFTDPNADMLCDMSSELPPSFLDAASSLGYSVEPHSRGFLYNADVVTVIDFLNIGTRSVTPSGLRQLTEDRSQVGNFE